MKKTMPEPEVYSKTIGEDLLYNIAIFVAMFGGFVAGFEFEVEVAASVATGAAWAIFSISALVSFMVPNYATRGYQKMAEKLGGKMYLAEQLYLVLSLLLCGYVAWNGMVALATFAAVASIKSFLVSRKGYALWRQERGGGNDTKRG